MDTKQMVSVTDDRFLDYLDALTEVETRREELKRTKEKVLSTQEYYSIIPPQPVKEKAIIKWGKMIIILIASTIFQNMGIFFLSLLGYFLFKLSLLGAGIYVFYRYYLAKNSYKVAQKQWENRRDYNNTIRGNCQIQLPTLDTMIANCTDTLRRLYSIGPLDAYYQNLSAVATFYDWFRKGMTSSLIRQGADPGAYNMYEEKCRHNEIIGRLDNIELQIKSIGQNQQRLLTAVNKIQSTAETISNQLSQMSVNLQTVATASIATAATNAQIANNTGVAAYYSRINAQNSEYLNRYVIK